MDRKIILIAHNLRSTHNVGSLLRTAEGIGLEFVYLTGYSPYPKAKNEDRLPYLAEKINRQIIKTSLGAENLVQWEHRANIEELILSLKSESYGIIALEQSKTSKDLIAFPFPDKIALIVGREVEGIESEILKLCDSAVFIPMHGEKESFNVVQAAAMALYRIRFLK